MLINITYTVDTTKDDPTVIKPFIDLLKTGVFDKEPAQPTLDFKREETEETEKDLDEMTFDELKDLALKLGIDTAGKRAAGLRKAIREHDETDESGDAAQEADEAEEAEEAETEELESEEEEEVEEEEDDLLGDAEEDDAPEPTFTIKDAVKRVSELVNKGLTKEVRSALTEMGAKRVSDLQPEQVDDFMASVSAL